MSKLTISPSVALELFAHATPLFQRYRYWNRLSGKGVPLPEPISDAEEALVLLYAGRNDRTRRFVATDAMRPDGTKGPVVRIEIYSSGYTKEEFTTSYDFPLAESVLEKLKRDSVLSRIAEPGHADGTRLQLNGDAVDMLMSAIEKYSQEHADEEKRNDGA